jgi:hypothetical protein
LIQSLGSVVLSGPSLIYDPNAGGDVQVTLQLAGDGLYIFDSSGARLHHWPYATIMNAGANFILAHNSHPDVRLTVGDHTLYQAIAIRAPQLSQPPEVLTREQGDRMRGSMWSNGTSGSTFVIILLGFLAVSAILAYLP